MWKNKKVKINIGTTIFSIIIILIFILIGMFMITKSIFGYRPFIDYNEKNLIITKIIEPSTIKENDIIVFETGDKLLGTKVIKIGSQNNRYYFTVNNYDNKTTIVLNQSQIKGKVIHEIQGLGAVLLKVQIVLSIVGIVIIISLLSIFMLIKYKKFCRNKGGENK